MAGLLGGDVLGGSHGERGRVHLVGGAQLVVRPVDRLLELVDEEVLAQEVAEAVARAADHVRGDRRREHLEEEHGDEHHGRAEALRLQGQREEHEDHAEDLRLRGRVHAGEGIREAEEADARRDGEHAAQDEEHEAHDVEGVGQRTGREDVVHEGSCFET